MKKLKIAGLVSVALVTSLVLIEPAFAGFGEIGDNIASATTGMSKATKSVGLLIGIGLSIGGLIGFATHKKTNTPLSIPIIMLIAGILLSSLTAFVGSGSETVFGSDEQEWNNINGSL